MPGGGLIFAIGWPGQWACSFIRDDQRSLRHTDSLEPGEPAKSPSPALKGTLSPSEGERDGVRGRSSAPRHTPIQADGSVVPSLRVVAGQQVTHLFLKPGEEIRTPLIAALFWKGGDTVRAQNLWRRWFMAHNIPRINGRPPPTMLQMQCYRTFEKGGEKDLYDTVEEFNQNSIPFDLCWRDAVSTTKVDFPELGSSGHTDKFTQRNRYVNVL